MMNQEKINANDSMKDEVEKEVEKEVEVEIMDDDELDKISGGRRYKIRR